jgi:6-phosphofructokinase 1
MCDLHRCIACFLVVAEERFELHGQNGVLTYLKGLLERNSHAVICVAEGAGQELMHPGRLLPVLLYSAAERMSE